TEDFFPLGSSVSSVVNAFRSPTFPGGQVRHRGSSRHTAARASDIPQCLGAGAGPGNRATGSGSHRFRRTQVAIAESYSTASRPRFALPGRDRADVAYIGGAPS